MIGSFRAERYGGIREALKVLRTTFRITSPSGTDIVDGVQFVRFESDLPSASDDEIQTATLQKIFSADAVYVVAPGGYVGKTTCYEIGRVLQRRQPLYFSERPQDLPVHIPDWSVVTPGDFVLRFSEASPFVWLFADASGDNFDVERSLAPC